MFKFRLCGFIVIIVTSLLSLLPATALADESDTGTISGQVINNTEGGGSVAGIEISLITYVDGVADEDKIEKTTTDGEGRFQFDDVAIENEYLVSVTYMEVSYYYLAVFEDGETTADVEVYVFDTTDSDEFIRVEQAHTIISVVSAEENSSVGEDYLLVTEFFVLVNDGDKTYVGTNGVLVFTLPQGATDVQVSQGEVSNYELLDDNRLTYLVPIPPEERQVSYSYTLPIPSLNSLTIPLQVHYPTDALDVMVSGEGIEVTTTQLIYADPVVMGTGKKFIHFRSEDLSRGTVISLHFSKAAGVGGTLFVVLYVIVGVVIAGIAVYLVKRIVGSKRNE